MNLVEALDVIDDGFKETVLPAISRGHLKTAHDELTNLDLALKLIIKEIASYHSGIHFVASVRTLYRELGQGEHCPKTVAEFQAYLAQLKLSAKSGNIY